MTTKYGKKITQGLINQTTKALTDLTDYYAPILIGWQRATPAQREAYLAHSPVLTAVLAFARPFIEVK